jgi:hypothetical protein
MRSHVVMAANADTSGFSPLAIREIVDALTPISLASCRHDIPLSARAASRAACSAFTFTLGLPLITVPDFSHCSTCRSRLIEYNCSKNRALIDIRANGDQPYHAH